MFITAVRKNGKHNHWCKFHTKVFLVPCYSTVEHNNKFYLIFTLHELWWNGKRYEKNLWIMSWSCLSSVKKIIVCIKNTHNIFQLLLCIQGLVFVLFCFVWPPKGGRGCLMSSPCLESQGCHLIPLSFFLSFFVCLVILLSLSCHFSANGPLSWLFPPENYQTCFVKG